MVISAGETLSKQQRLLNVSLFLGNGIVDTLTEHSADVRSIAFSPDSSLLASGDEDGIVNLWDSSSHQLVDTLIGYPGYSYGVMKVEEIKGL